MTIPAPLAMALALLAVSAGCGHQAPAPHAAPSEAAADSLLARSADVPDDLALDAGFPRTLVLPDGGELHLAAAPRRIVPASAASVDLLAALVPPERIAGLPAQARDYSSLGTGGERGAEFLARPQFSAYAAEPLLALQPDLVIVDGWQLADTTLRLREAGVTVLPLAALESLAEVRATLTLLGRACGTEARAQAVNAALEARIAALRRGAGRRAGVRVLAYSNGGSGGWVAGAGTAADEWIRLAGFSNAAAGRVGHERCSFEELLLLDPDLIVVSGPSNFDGKGITESLLRGERALVGLRALHGGRIIVLPAWLYDTVSQHIVTASEALARGADRALAQQ